MICRVLLIASAVTTAMSLAGGTRGSPMSFSTSYGSKTAAGYRLPSVPVYKVPRKYHRQLMRYDKSEKTGTVIVDTGSGHLHFIMVSGKATRYGIGIGRQPELAKYRGGMRPGLNNPLDARALYLYNRNGDTEYRLHGSPEWWSIGKKVSSGCIRLVNQDITDLDSRVETGARVIVR